jgi:hypothetical protein
VAELTLFHGYYSFFPMSLFRNQVNSVFNHIIFFKALQVVLLWVNLGILNLKTRLFRQLCDFVLLGSVAMLPLLLAGCNTSVSHEGSSFSIRGRNSTEVTVHELKLKFPVELVSISNQRPVSLEVIWNKTNTVDAPDFHWNRALTSSREQGLLIAFLSNQALNFAEGRPVFKNISIRCTKGESSLALDRRDHNYWVLQTERMEYCERTCAIRVNSDSSKVLHVLPLSEADSDVWIPLTRDSYDAWWGKLSQEVDFKQLFDN